MFDLQVMLNLIQNLLDQIKHLHPKLLGGKFDTWEHLVSLSLIVWMIGNFVHEVLNIPPSFPKGESGRSLLIFRHRCHDMPPFLYELSKSVVKLFKV